MPYYIPRNTKGEGRILFIFSTKALIYTGVGVGIGLVFRFILNLFGLGVVGWIIMGILGLIGFSIATFKVPEINNFDFTKKAGGLNIDEVILRAYKFNRNKKIYVFDSDSNSNISTKEENKNG